MTSFKTLNNIWIHIIYKTKLASFFLFSSKSESLKAHFDNNFDTLTSRRRRAKFKYIHVHCTKITNLRWVFKNANFASTQLNLWCNNLFQLSWRGNSNKWLHPLVQNNQILRKTMLLNAHTVLVLIKLRLRFLLIDFLTLYYHFSLNLRTLYIVWSLVRRRVTRRITRLQTMCNFLKYRKIL